MAVAERKLAYEAVQRERKYKRNDELLSMRKAQKLERQKKIKSGQASNPTPIVDAEPATRACSICATNKDPVEFPLEIAIPPSCSAHRQTVCQSCLGESISTNIANKPLDRIGCPICDQAWNRDYVEIHAKAESLQVYYTREALVLLETLPEFRVCQSPTCHSGQFHASGAAEPIVTCNDCGFRSCFVHHMPWHSGKTCVEVDDPGETDEELRARLAREAKDYEQKYGKGTKPCPRCNAVILKKGGCDAMLCKYSALHAVEMSR